MTRTADKTNSFIAMVLGLNGRVRPADLQSIPAEARVGALRAFAEAHGAETQLHLAGDELVAGPRPEPVTPPLAASGALEPMLGATPADAPQAQADQPTRPADLTADGQSAVDLLLGDYDGAPEYVPAPVVGPDSGFGPATDLIDTPLPASSASAPSLTAAPSLPDAERDTSRTWLLWWIPTLLVPVLGGSAAWLFLRRKRQFAARAMLTTALVLGLLVSIGWLRYAEQLGALVEQRSATSVIVLPSK